MTKKTNNYKDSGVNVQEGQDFINDIKDELNDLQNNFAIGSIGGFSGYIDPEKPPRGNNKITFCKSLSSISLIKSCRLEGVYPRDLCS